MSEANEKVERALKKLEEMGELEPTGRWNQDRAREMLGAIKTLAKQIREGMEGEVPGAGLSRMEAALLYTFLSGTGAIRFATDHGMASIVEKLREAHVEATRLPEPGATSEEPT